jgi:hypothetical protein
MVLKQPCNAGSARTVNRRYIAIFVAFKDRTWASALFVSLSAVGMALGPLLALPLSHFPTLRFAGLTFDHVRFPRLDLFVFSCPWTDVRCPFHMFTYGPPQPALCCPCTSGVAGMLSNDGIFMPFFPLWRQTFQAYHGQAVRR